MHLFDPKEVLKRFENVKSFWAVYSAPLWNKKHKFNRTLVIDSPSDLQFSTVKEYHCRKNSKKHY